MAPTTTTTAVVQAEEEEYIEPYKPLYHLRPQKPVFIHQSNDYDRPVFGHRPFFAVLLFDNSDSDARDHCANERTFLSWLRLATYMAVMSVAIIVSFHIRHKPSSIERRLALPFGLVFWLLSLACLASGLANYVKSVAKYSRRQALVQTGWRTQVVFTVLASTIVAACVLFLSTNATTR